MSRSVENLPADVIVEIFLYAGVRETLRFISTTKKLYDLWCQISDPRKKSSEVLWFKFCFSCGLCPVPIDLKNQYLSRTVDENTIGNFSLPKGFTSWKDCCLERYPKSLQCVNCKREHKGMKPEMLTLLNF
eukprot:TRINITY_DN1712_c0_g2_i3.p1 TRINITY_DN1712_c0_g2~~TRINITY_DN1712_c0_g2_i3.p1  ORF type:complete len:131 (+),score=6.22 TRINITY_DN1712_c0_g2_i3:74-466(+)